MKQLLQTWCPDFSRIRYPAYLTIADLIEEAIVGGIFAPGDRLPTARAMSDNLGFHLNTILAAYHEIARRGLVLGRSRAGTVVLSR